VELDLFIDTSHVMTFKAGDHRPDLMRAGYGNGNHGFAVDIAHLNLAMDQTVTVRIAGRDFILDGSGKKLGEYLKAL
jgi:hypothetical protein